MFCIVARVNALRLLKASCGKDRADGLPLRPLFSVRQWRCPICDRLPPARCDGPARHVASGMTDLKGLFEAISAALMFDRFGSLSQ